MFTCRNCNQPILEGKEAYRYTANGTAWHVECGRYLPLTNGDKHFEICKKLNETYRQKNADYGDSFGNLFDKYGAISAVIRLADKHSRFEQLIENPAQVKNESKIDTALDAANYWIMTAMKLMENDEQQLTKKPPYADLDDEF